jgi:2-isopropylmalate synthase
MRRIQIYDTTLRDGAQGEGISFSLDDKLLLAARLDSLGFDYIEGGYPASNEKDLQFFAQVKPLNLRAKICAFGMTRRKGGRAEDDQGLRTLLDAGTPVITIVGKSSLFQVTEVLQTSREENLAMIRDSVEFLARQGREVIFDAEHFFDGWKADAEYTLAAVQTAAAAGARLIVLCDTNGGSLPEEIARITRAVTVELPAAVGIHCHNDCDLAVANSLAGVDAGAVQVQGTINGFGERCGNADLISVVANLACKKQGYEVLRPDSLPRLTELSRFVYETVNINFRSHQPFVGRSAFAHKGGMHVSGVARVAAAYEHIDPQTVGNERRVLVSELSGRSNIVARTQRHHLDPNSKLMEKILARVVSLENAGYQFEAADGSFDLLVRQCMGTFQPHFEMLKYHVNVETVANGEPTTLATIKVRVGDSIRHEVAEGDGPVNALDAAMRKALNGCFPNLRRLLLVDYKVRVINFQAATAAGVRVIVQSRDEHQMWGTVGVSENIIEASWKALSDSFEYKLCKDEDQQKNHRHEH